MSSSDAIVEKIQTLKKEKNALIVAHYYQIGETQDIADFVGDGLGMVKAAAESEADVIIVGGVVCMAETIKLACPDKTVILPDLNAGCTLSNMISPKRLVPRKEAYPNAEVLIYMNTTPDAKALADICFGEDEAVSILEGIATEQEVMYVPDQYMGDLAATKTGHELVLWPGYCSPIVKIRADEVKARKQEHPEAKVVAHIECVPQVKLLADIVTSTNGMMKYAAETDAKEFIIATEVGILHSLRKANPGKTFIAASELGSCATMKLVNLETILWSLENLEPVIEIPDGEVKEKAKKVVDDMLARQK